MTKQPGTSFKQISNCQNFITPLRLTNFDEVKHGTITEAERQQTIANIEQGFRELKLTQEGNLQARPVEEVLWELAE